MKGDLSRATFPVRRYTRVVAQQGRVQLDADWNEQQAIIDHRLRTALADVFGGGEATRVAVAPHANPGFGIHVHGGVAFDGTAAGISVPYAGSCGGADPFTLELWLRPADADGKVRTVLARTGDATPAAGEFRVGLDPDGCVVFERFEAGAAAATALTSRCPLPSDGFSFVACVFTGTTAELWIDGEIDGRIAARPGASHPELPLTVGGAAAAGDAFTGTIEQIRMWRRRRPAHELSAAYAGHGGRGAPAEPARRGDAPALEWTAADAPAAAPRADGLLCASPGRCYVDGWMCEQDRHVPLGATGFAPGDELLAYLDVWERYVGAAEDPSLADPALGGVDTTGRLQTVAAVRLTANAAELAELADRAADRGQIAVGVAAGILQDNLLYRVEVHAGGTAASDDPGPATATVEPADDGSPGSETVVRTVDGAKPDWPSGQYLQLVDQTISRSLMRVISAGPDGTSFTVDRIPDPVRGPVGVRPVASVLWSKNNAATAFPLAGAPEADERSSTVVVLDAAGRASLLEIGQVVTISDEAGEAASVPGFVSTISAMNTDVPGQIRLVVPGRVSGSGAGAVLRSWDGIIAADARSGAEATRLRNADVSVAFTAGATYGTGDYWTARLRPDAHDPLDWPHDANGRPAFRPPDGVAHTYAELARVRIEPGGPRVEHDLRRIVRSVAELHVHAEPRDERPAEVAIGGEAEHRHHHEHDHEPPEERHEHHHHHETHVVREGVPAPGMVLARRAPEGYVPTGGVVEAVVDYPDWKPARPAPERGAASAVTIDGAIYLLFERGTLWRLDPSHPANPWEQCRTWDGVRRDYAVAAAGGALYVLGGVDRNGRPSRLVDRYDPRADTWSDMPAPMRAARTRFAAAGSERGIVVCGGVRRTWFGCWYVSETIEEYDLAANAWYALPAMPFRRYGGAAVFAGGSLFLIGGKLARGVFSRPRERSARVDRLRYGAREWSRELPLSEPRVYARAAAVGEDEIVVAGGALNVDAPAERIRAHGGAARQLPSPLRTRFGLAAAGGAVYAMAGRLEDADLHDALRCTLLDRIRVYRPAVEDDET